jgi:hypothetical protein
VFVPAPAKAYLAVFKSFTSVQLVPFQDSVCCISYSRWLKYPPKAKAAVLVPAPPGNSDLAVFKSLTSVQLVPFQVSVFAAGLGVYPPKAKAAVFVPAPPKP